MRDTINKGIMAEIAMLLIKDMKELHLTVIETTTMW
jgi:hypothetical protein